MLNLDKNKKYLLACSFGPDSMALFTMLLKEGYNFDIALVNYHLRKESDFEESSLREIARKNNLNIYVKEVNDLNGQTGTEEKARKIRYRFFEDLTKKNNYYATLVAHHEDDLIETYLMQKRRGNYVKYYGLKEETLIFNINIIRPLLKYSKQYLLEYCEYNKIPFSIDSTNNEDHFLRNKIRHHIVSKMSEEERRAILKKINDENKKVEAIFNLFKCLDLSSISSILSLGEESFCYALNFLSESIKKDQHLSKKLCLEIKNILISSKPNISFKINSKITLLKEYDRFHFISSDLNSNQFSYIVNANSPKLDTPYFYLNFTNGGENRNVYSNDYPLTIRNASINDLVKIKGYYVKVRRLFIDWKMPLSLRKRWPVIVNNQNLVIYTPRYQSDFIKTKDINFYVK